MFNEEDRPLGQYNKDREVGKLEGNDGAVCGAGADRLTISLLGSLSVNN